MAHRRRPEKIGIITEQLLAVKRLSGSLGKPADGLPPGSAKAAPQPSAEKLTY